MAAGAVVAEMAVREHNALDLLLLLVVESALVATTLLATIEVGSETAAVAM